VILNTDSTPLAFCFAIIYMNSSFISDSDFPAFGGGGAACYFLVGDFGSRGLALIFLIYCNEAVGV